MSLILLICNSCKKSNDQAASIPGAADNAAQGFKFSITNRENLGTNSKLISSADEAARGFKMGFTNQVGFPETLPAGEVLRELHEQGQLPGDSNNEPGDLTSDTVEPVVSNNAVVMVYPALRTFHLVKTGETSTNNYTLVRLSKDLAWRLKRTWRTDLNGEVIQEWPVN